MVLRHLGADPYSSQRDVAKELRLSIFNINYCFKALMDKGLVNKKKFPNSINKFSYFYVLNPAGVVDMAAFLYRFLLRKTDVHKPPEAEIEALVREVSDDELAVVKADDR